MIKDSIIFNYKLSSTESLKKCTSCNSHAHCTLHCPLLQYIPDREKIIKRHEFSHIQERDAKFKRMRFRSKNSLSLQKSSIKIACKLQKELKKSATLFNFSHLRRIMNADSPIDSNLFDSKKSLPSIENVQSSASSSEDDVELSSRSFTEESIKDGGIKENIKKVYEKIIVEDGVKRNHLNLEEIGEERERKESKETLTMYKEYLDGEQRSLVEKQTFQEQRSLREKTSEHRKTERGNSYRNVNIINELELKRPQSKQNLRNEKQTPTILTNVNNSSCVINNNNSFINNSVTKVSTSNNNNTNYRKRSIFSAKPDILFDFEKGENFDHYFPFFNLDNILKIYDKKRRKLAFMRKFNPSNQDKSNNSQTLKNFGKYSFFPLHCKTTKEINMKSKVIDQETNSPFFKRKEFQKKSITFLVLVKELLTNKNNKSKKVTMKV